MRTNIRVPHLRPTATFGTLSRYEEKKEEASEIFNRAALVEYISEGDSQYGDDVAVPAHKLTLNPRDTSETWQGSSEDQSLRQHTIESLRETANGAVSRRSTLSREEVSLVLSNAIVPCSREPERHLLKGKPTKVYFHEEREDGEIERVPGRIVVSREWLTCVYERRNEREDRYKVETIFSVGFEVELSQRYNRERDICKCFNIIVKGEDTRTIFIEALEADELADLVIGLSRLCK